MSMKYAWLLALLVCCGEQRWPDYNARTPDGYRVVLPDALGVERDLVLVWVDVRVAGWIAARQGSYDLAGLYNLAQTTTYFVVDDYRFGSASSPTGWAVGDINTYSKHPTLRCSVYDQAYGQLASDGMGLAVIPHELDHRLGVNH